MTLFVVYVFGMLAGLIIAGFVNRLSPSEWQMALMMELPAYRIPALVTIVRKSVQRPKHFVTKAGAVILGVIVVIWIWATFGIRARILADLGWPFWGSGLKRSFSRWVWTCTTEWRLSVP